MQPLNQTFFNLIWSSFRMPANKILPHHSDPKLVHLQCVGEFSGDLTILVFGHHSALESESVHPRTQHITQDCQITKQPFAI